MILPILLSKCTCWSEPRHAAGEVASNGHVLSSAAHAIQKPTISGAASQTIRAMACTTKACLHQLSQMPNTDAGLYVFEAILTAQCWAFDSTDASKPLLCKPLLESFAMLHQKSSAFESHVQLKTAHGRCLQLLRQRAEARSSTYICLRV
jgi:hypothetical protein